MARQFSETLDGVEKEYAKTFLQREFSEYISFWEKHIGFRDINSDNDLLQPYKLIDTNSAADATLDIQECHWVLCMAHYSQFLHLIGAKRRIADFSGLDGSSGLLLHELQLRLMLNLSYIYMHLDAAIEQEIEMWDMAHHIKNGNSGKKARGRLANMKFLLGHFSHHNYDDETEQVFNSIFAVRHFVVHRSRIVSKVFGNNVKFCLPHRPIAMNKRTPTWEEQIKSIPEADPNRRAQDDLDALLTLLRKLRPELQKDLNTILKNKGLEYNYNVKSAGSVSTEFSFSGSAAVTVQAFSSGSCFIAPSGTPIIK